MNRVTRPPSDAVDGGRPADRLEVAPDIQRILDSPAFAELRARRRRTAIVLTTLMLAIYYGFIVAIAFAPQWLAIRISGVITLGIPLGLGVILSAIGLTGLYVRRANREFDQLTADAIRSARA